MFVKKGKGGERGWGVRGGGCGVGGWVGRGLKRERGEEGTLSLSECMGLITASRMSSLKYVMVVRA